MNRHLDIDPFIFQLSQESTLRPDQIRAIEGSSCKLTIVQTLVALNLMANIHTFLIKSSLVHCHLKPAQIFLRLNDSFAHFLNFESQEVDDVPVSNDSNKQSYFFFQLTLFRMKVQKVQEVLCSGFLDVLRLSSLRSRYLSVYEKVRLLMMEKCTIHVCLCTYLNKR